jgi:ribosomal protein L24E
MLTWNVFIMMPRTRVYKLFTMNSKDEPRKQSWTEVSSEYFKLMKLAQNLTKIAQTNSNRFQMEKRVERCWFCGLKPSETPGRPSSSNGGQGRGVWEDWEWIGQKLSHWIIAKVFVNVCVKFGIKWWCIEGYWVRFIDRLSTSKFVQSRPN